MPDLRLVQLIDSVAEGADVNWDDVTSAARSDHERQVIEDLRTVADIAQVHRIFASAPEHDTIRQLDLSGWGDLEVIERLGGGGFGDVYLARDGRLNRLVALKVLAQSVSAQVPLAAQLLEEARILARVRHPNVVGVFGAAVHRGRAGFWMEFVAGDTLEDRLVNDGPLGADEAAAVGRQVCRALAAVHNAGLIHRDVKARNIMRERGGRIVLMDFGAGIPIEQPADGHGARVGTPMYLAPETLAGAPATVQSDVYAVGVLLYHLVTGRFPYAAASLEELQRAHASSSAAPLQSARPELPAPLIHVIERALAPIELRFQSSGEMAAALERVIVDPPARRRSPVAGWTAGLIAVACILTGLLLWWTSGGASSTFEADALVVTAFANRSGQPAFDALATGLARDVHRELRRMRVTVRGGVTAASDRVLEASVIAREEAADAVITATLNRATSGRFDLGVRVLTASGALAWTRDYGASEEELPGLARRVAHDIADALGVTATARAANGPMPYLAYSAYQRGRVHAELRTPASLLRSVEYFREAIRLAPDHAEPWAGLADSYIAMGVPTFGLLTPREARRQANDAAITAVKLDPESAEAHTSLAFIAFFHDWDWPTAEARFKKAIELDPQYALAHDWYGDYLNAMGRHAEALAEVRTALSQERQSLLYHRDVGYQYFFQRRYDEAIEQLRHTLERDPSYTAARSLLGRALVEAGRPKEGIDELRRAAPGLPRPTALLFLAYAEAAAGSRQQAERHLREALSLEPTAYVAPTYVALAYTALGQPEQALAWLRRGYETQDSTMVNVYQDPRLDLLRGREEFAELLRKMKFPGSTAAARE
jgi:eukaryotic-like serine/threonine-protein kinase